MELPNKSPNVNEGIDFYYVKKNVTTLTSTCD